MPAFMDNRLYGHRLRCSRMDETPSKPLQTPDKAPKNAAILYMNDWRRRHSLSAAEGRSRASQTWKDLSAEERQYWIDKFEEVKDRCRREEEQYKIERACQKEFRRKVFQYLAMQFARLYQQYGDAFLGSFPERDFVLHLLQEQERLIAIAMDANDPLRTEGTLLDATPWLQSPGPQMLPNHHPPSFVSPAFGSPMPQHPQVYPHQQVASNGAHYQGNYLPNTGYAQALPRVPLDRAATSDMQQHYPEASQHFVPNYLHYQGYSPTNTAAYLQEPLGPSPNNLSPSSQDFLAAIDTTPLEPRLDHEAIRGILQEPYPKRRKTSDDDDN